VRGRIGDREWRSEVSKCGRIHGFGSRQGGSSLFEFQNTTPRIDLGHALTWEGSLRYTVVELGFWLILQQEIVKKRDPVILAKV
jgi:hypothetical protein